VTFISIHLVSIYVVLLWRTYETHPALSLKSGCDRYMFVHVMVNVIHVMVYVYLFGECFLLYV
jgi:hypothetical protein